MRAALKIANTFVLLAGWLASAEAQPGEMPRIYRSAYFTGRGDTGIATADYHDAIFYNPAGIAQGKGVYKETVVASPMMEVSMDTKNLAREVGSENSTDPDTLRKHIGQPQHVGAYNFSGIVLRRAALGAVSSGQANILVAKSKDQAGLETATGDATITQGMTFSLAQDFGEHFLAGVTTKYLVRGQGAASASIADADKLKDLKQDDIFGYGTGAGADLGLMVRGGGRLDPSFGLTVQDMGGTRFKANDGSHPVETLAQTINLGVAISPGTKLSHFRFLADFHDATGNVTTNVYKRTHFGTELTVLDLVGVTGGLNQGYPTAGIYVDVKLLRIDVGAYTEEVGERAGSRPDRRFFGRLSLGF